MNTLQLDTFHIIGIAITTSNQDGASGTAIPELWNTFMSNNIANTIQNKITTDLYCVYTKYEGDHTQPYTTLLGCKVNSLEHIPEGCVGMTFDAATYSEFTAKGNLMQGAVWNAWTTIWDTPLDRTYTADFEVYGKTAQNPEDATVPIYIGVKS